MCFARNGVSLTLAAFYSKAQIDPALHQVDLKRGRGERISDLVLSGIPFYFFRPTRHTVPEIQGDPSAYNWVSNIGRVLRKKKKKELLLTPPLVHQPDVFTQKRDYFFRVSQLESRLAEYRR